MLCSPLGVLRVSLIGFDRPMHFFDAGSQSNNRVGVVGQSPAARVANLSVIQMPACRYAWGIFPTAEPTVMPNPSPSRLYVRPSSPPRLLFVRGCRMHLPSVWSTRCACPTVAVVFRFILLCLCLPASRWPDWGDCRSKPVPGEPVTWPAFSLDGSFSGRQLRGRSS